MLFTSKYYTSISRKGWTEHFTIELVWTFGQDLLVTKWFELNISLKNLSEQNISMLR